MQFVKLKAAFRVNFDLSKQTDRQNEKVTINYRSGPWAVKYLLTKGQRVIALVADTHHFSVELLANPQLEIIVLNPACENEVLRICENIGAKYGRIDKMVNNAGATSFMFRHILPLTGRVH